MLVDATHVKGICGNLGAFWRELGIQLNTPEAMLCNIHTERSSFEEKAKKILLDWIKRNGRSATVQRLIDALAKIKQGGRIAGKLLGTLENFLLVLPPNRSHDRTNLSMTRDRRGFNRQIHHSFTKLSFVTPERKKNRL